MSAFKDMVESDNKGVFLNLDEFAENKTVKYDGDIYSDIPVVLTKTKESKKTVVTEMTGVHLVSAVAHIALADLNGIQPEQKRYIEISDGMALGEIFFVKYRIITSDLEMGMLRLELEAYDE